MSAEEPKLPTYFVFDWGYIATLVWLVESVVLGRPPRTWGEAVEAADRVPGSCPWGWWWKEHLLAAGLRMDEPPPADLREREAQAWMARSLDPCLSERERESCAAAARSYQRRMQNPERQAGAP